MSAPQRDPVVNLIRAAGTVGVVLGHWLLAAVTVAPDGDIQADNLLRLAPSLQPATWLLQVVPLFFLAGGCANALSWARARADGTSPAAFVAVRTRRLALPVLVPVGLACLLLTVLAARGLPPDDLQLAGRLLVQPLWFLATYVLVIALTPAMVRWHQRSVAEPFLLLGAAVVAVDAARFGPVDDRVGWVNGLLGWLLVHQLGVAYGVSGGGSGAVTADVRRRSAVVCAVSPAVLVATVAIGPYPVSMVGVPGEAVSNMSPPTLALVLLAVTQGAACLAARPTLDRLVALRWVGSGVEVLSRWAMGLLLWHPWALVAVVLVVRRLGVPLPVPDTWHWWLTRPLWLAVLAAVLVLLLRSVAGGHGTVGPDRVAARPAGGVAASVRLALSATAAGVVLSAGGLLVLALRGVAPGGWPAAGVSALVSGLLALTYAEHCVRSTIPIDRRSRIRS